MPKKPTTKPITKELSREEAIEKVGAKGVESLQLKEDENFIKKQREAIKAECMPLVRTYGVPTDDKGSLSLECDSVVAKITKKAFGGPNPDHDHVEKYLKARKLWDKVTTLVVDPNKIQALRATGEITEKDIAEITEINYQEAFSFEFKKEGGDEQTATD